MPSWLCIVWNIAYVLLGCTDTACIYSVKLTSEVKQVDKEMEDAEWILYSVG